MSPTATHSPADAHHTMFPPTIGFLSSTRAQNWLAAAVLGAAPGIYLAITGLGAGGGMSNSVKFSQIQNSLANGLFGVFSFFMPLALRHGSESPQSLPHSPQTCVGSLLSAPQGMRSTSLDSCTSRLGMR